MNQSNQLAQATGSMGIVSALGIAIQWGLGLLHITVTNDQAAALSILMFPFIHLVFIRIGAKIDRESEARDRRATDAREAVK